LAKIVHIDPTDVLVIAPNFKQRLSGVTSTIIQLVPIQNGLGQKVAVLGPGLPGHLPHIRFRDLWKLWQRPEAYPVRVFHARRNLEMLAGLVLRDILRMPLRLVFTSASQRHHTGYTRWLISRMDKVIATSAKTSTYLAVRNIVNMHGIDTERFSPPRDKAEAKRRLGLPEDKKIAGCFGRVRHQKGTDLFVDAMMTLLPKHPDWIAIIAGRATEKHIAFERELKAKVQAVNLGEQILFVGEHTNINDWYRALDLFIAPQRWEGFGLTPLEAMASGVPVVATDVGAFRELVVVGNKETGMIMETTAPALAAGAALYMTDETRRTMAGKNAIAHAQENFPLQREATALGAIYEEQLALA
jgi:mannosyltransferase